MAVQVPGLGLKGRGHLGVPLWVTYLQTPQKRAARATSHAKVLKSDPPTGDLR